MSHVKQEYFETALLQTMAQITLDYWKQYNAPPTETVLRSELQKLPISFTPEEGLQFDTLCKHVAAGTFADIDYIRASFADFIRNRELMATLATDESQALIEKGDWQGMIHQLRKAEPQIQHMDADTELFNIMVLEPLWGRHAMKTGLNLIDGRLQGLYRKEMLLLMGDKKAGKSLFLTYIGGQLLRNGHKVLHVTLEMGKARVMVRYFATLSEPQDNIRYSDLHNLVNQDYLVAYVYHLKQKYHGRLALLEMPAGPTKPADVEPLIERHEPDVVIIDYLNLMKPQEHYESERFRLTDIATHPRGIATTGNFPCFETREEE